MAERVAQIAKPAAPAAVSHSAHAHQQERRIEHQHPTAVLLRRMQSTVGNQAALRRLLQVSPGPIALRRSCDCGGSCEECQKNKLQRSAVASATPQHAPASVHQVLGSPAQALPQSTQAFFQSRLQHDFSRVQVHTGEAAARSAADVSALAYTVGNHVVFGAGQYFPSTVSGQKLLAHELVHVVQQSRGGAPSLQNKLAVGAVDDPAEHEAEALATAAVNSNTNVPLAAPAATAHPVPLLRRVPATPQGVHEVRHAEQNLPDGGKRHLMRYIALCPCRVVNDPSSGLFYNSNLDDLALVYRRCSGNLTWDFYGRLQSNAQQALQTPAVPQGTGRAGGTLHIGGTGTQGRVDVYGLGANDTPGGAAGGGVGGVLQSGNWTFYASGEYRRLLQPPTGRSPDTAQFRAGACIPGTDLCFGPQATINDPTQGNTLTFGVHNRASVPRVAQQTCSICVCPRRRDYSCWEDHPEHPETHPVEVVKTPEFHYYFAWNSSTDQSEANYLRTASHDNFQKIFELLRTGRYHIVSITGYASPEGREHGSGRGRSRFPGNQPLADARARTTAARLRQFLGEQGMPDSAVPEQVGGLGELVGHGPLPPSTELRAIILDAGFHSAEEASALLMGDEIADPDLQRQFRTLLSDPRMTPDLQMELFGLEHDDPSRPHVLEAVATFLRARSGAFRPWDPIFQLFRSGAISLRGTETENRTTTVDAHSDTLDPGPCRQHAGEVEAQNGFGPLDPAALEATTRPANPNVACSDNNAQQNQDCHYEPPPGSSLTPNAPDIAPNRINLGR
jgi:Domain of unknown function (DUF4157)